MLRKEQITGKGSKFSFIIVSNGTVNENRIKAGHWVSGMGTGCTRRVQ